MFYILVPFLVGLATVVVIASLRIPGMRRSDYVVLSSIPPILLGIPAAIDHGHRSDMSLPILWFCVLWIVANIVITSLLWRLWLRDTNRAE